VAISSFIRAKHNTYGDDLADALEKYVNENENSITDASQLNWFVGQYLNSHQRKKLSRLHFNATQSRTMVPPKELTEYALAFG